MTWKRNDEPIWIYEAALALARYEKEEMDEIIENRIQSGQSKESIERMFAGYKEYRRAVMGEIEKIMPTEPYLLECIKAGDEKWSVISSFALYVTKHGILDIEDEKFEEHILKFIQDVYEDWLNIQEDAQAKLVADFDTFFCEMSKSELELRKQMQLVTIYHKRKEFYTKSLKLLNEIVRILKKHRTIIEEDLKKSIDYFSIEENIKKLYDKHYGIQLNESVLSLHFSIFGYNIIQYYADDATGEMNAVIGIYAFQLIESKSQLKKNEIYLTESFKAIADVSRIHILHMLQERPMYTQEIAEELSLTPATVSHHMNLLLQKQLVSVFVTSEKKKSRMVRYEIIPETFERLAKELLEFAKTEGRE